MIFHTLATPDPNTATLESDCREWRIVHRATGFRASTADVYRKVCGTWAWQVEIVAGEATLQSAMDWCRGRVAETDFARTTEGDVR